MTRSTCKFLSIAIIWLAVLLGGCSSSSDDAAAVSAKQSVSGTASMGLIKNGTVNIFALDADGQKTTPALTSGSTDDFGTYTLSVRPRGPILIEVTHGSYVDEATGETIDFDGVLRAVLPAVDEEVEVAVTPLTELAVRIAEHNGFTPEKISAANALLSQFIGASITATQPANPEDPEDFNNASEHSQNYALMLAALSQMAFDHEGVDVLEALADDLADMTLDQTGTTLTDALTAFLNNDNNKTGNTTADDLTTLLGNIVTRGFAATGSLAEAKQLLVDFLMSEGNENDYNDFITYMNGFMQSPMSADVAREAHLFNAMATLMNIYHHQTATSLLNITGLDLNSTNLEFANFLLDPAQKAELITFAANPDADVLVDEFAALETTLDAVANDLAQANDVKTSISMPNLGTTYLDNIDVQVLTMMTNAMQAACIAMQTLDLTVSDWNVAPQGEAAVDARDLITADVHLTEAQETEILLNNPNFLGYADKTRLPDFKNAVTNLRNDLQLVVTALNDLGEDGRHLRYRNAFGADSDRTLSEIKGGLVVLSSFVAAMDNPTAAIVTIHDECTSSALVKADDGFSYPLHTYNFYYSYHNPAGGEITVSDMVNGTKAPRDALLADNADPLVDYKPYVVPIGNPGLFAEKITEINWDYPFEDFTIHRTAITIDGDGADWDKVPVFFSEGTVQVKIAASTGSGNDYYVFLSDTADSGLHNSSTIDSNHLWFMLGSAPYFGAADDEYGAIGDFLGNAETIVFSGEDNNLDEVIVEDIEESTLTTAVEMRFRGGLDLLISGDRINEFGFGWDRTNAEVDSDFEIHKTLKLYVQ